MAYKLDSVWLHYFFRLCYEHLKPIQDSKLSRASDISDHPNKPHLSMLTQIPPWPLHPWAMSALDTWSMYSSVHCGFRIMYVGATQGHGRRAGTCGSRLCLIQFIASIATQELLIAQSYLGSFVEKRLA